MKKRILCVLLAALMLIGIVQTAPFQAKAASNMTASQELIELIKQFEGFLKYPVWDYQQYSMGYGTYCSPEEYPHYAANGITVEEAEQRLKMHVNNFASAINSFIDTHGITMTQQQFDAMISLSYNCGTGWIRESTGYLHNALKSGATGNDLLFAFSLWSYTNYVVNDGLVKRRLAEANMYLNGVYSTSKPANYTYVKFDPNGGTLDYTVQGYDADVDTPIRVKIEPTYTSGQDTFTFVGWYTAKSGGTKIEVLDGSLGLGTVLYARWKTADGTVITPPEPEVKPVQGVQVTVTGTGVNIRSGPGTGYGVVGVAALGQGLTITETAQNDGYLWGKFGENQWIALQYTNYDSVNQGGNTQPPATQPPATEPPVTQPPATEPPVTQPPVTEPPVTQPPVTEPPVTQPPANAVTGTVAVGDSLNVRSGPGTGYPIVNHYVNGTRVTILEQQTVGTTRWGRTDLGWISMDYVRLDSGNPQPPVTEPPVTQPPQTQPPVTQPPVTQPPVTQPTYESWVGTVKVSDTLYIRSGPGTYHSISGYLLNGAQVTILEEKTVDGMRWGRIDKGWISLKYVVTNTATEPPVTEPTVPPTTQPETQPTTPTVPDDSATSGKWTGTVNVESILYIRKEPGVAGKMVGNLVNGTTVTITQRKTVDGKEWGKVDKGWICLDYVTIDGETTSPNKPSGGIGGATSSTVLEKPMTMTVNTCSLRIRSGAGITNTIVGYLSLGDEVVITETWAVGTTVWGKTDAGWVSLKYLK